MKVFEFDRFINIDDEDMISLRFKVGEHSDPLYKGFVVTKKKMNKLAKALEKLAKKVRKLA